MAVRAVVRHGDQSFATPVVKVREITDEIRTVIDDLVDTMRDGDTPGVGLAAPQIGQPLAIVVAEPPPGYGGTEAVYRGAIVLVNPEIVLAVGGTVVEEGCLSCPGATADVERPSRVIVKGLDRDGREVKLEVDGALARIFQHEIDHLLGRFFFDHLNLIKRQLVKARIRRT